MRIRYRLLLGFMAVVGIFILFGAYVYGVWQSMNADMASLDHLYETTSEQAVHELDGTLHMGLALETSRRTLFEYVLGDETAIDELRRSFVTFDQQYAEVADSLLVDGRSTAGDVALAALARIEAQHEHLEEDVAQIVAAVERGDRAVAEQRWQASVADEFAAISADLKSIEDDIEVRTAAVGAAFDDTLHGVEGRIRSLQKVMIAVLGIAILVAFAIGYSTARTISEPIEQLGDAAIAVEQGDFDPDSITAVTARQDELGSFARIFQHMAEEVVRREQQLRARISALHIEVDRQKSQEQVAEITESDFFKDLQSKARALRADNSAADG